MTCRIWDVDLGKCVAVCSHHKEFAYGVEWSLFGEGWIGTVGWDGRLFVTDWKRQWDLE